MYTLLKSAKSDKQLSMPIKGLQWPVWYKINYSSDCSNSSRGSGLNDTAEHCWTCIFEVQYENANTLQLPNQVVFYQTI